MPRAPLQIQSLARQHTEKAVKTLVQIMQQPKAQPAARVAAAQALLDRGWGKATQPIEGGDSPLVVQVVRYADDSTPE